MNARGARGKHDIFTQRHVEDDDDANNDVMYGGFNTYGLDTVNVRGDCFLQAQLNPICA